jgi:hypothetical protein
LYVGILSGHSAFSHKQISSKWSSITASPEAGRYYFVASIFIEYNLRLTIAHAHNPKCYVSRQIPMVAPDQIRFFVGFSHRDQKRQKVKFRRDEGDLK